MKKHLSRFGRARAFTLVELLVVIGIIALLISILLPALNRARAAAKTLQCMSSLRQYGLSDLSYVNANRGWHLPGYWGKRESGEGYYYNRTWTGLYEFRKSMGLPMIPQDDTGPNQGNVLFNYVTTKWYCPEALIHKEGFYAPMNVTVVPLHYSYGMNVEGVDTDNFASLDAAKAPYAHISNNTMASRYGSFAGFRNSQVKRSAEKLFMADGLYIVLNMTGSGPRPGFKGKESNYDFTGESTANGQGGIDTTRSTAWRHRGRANVLFFDGHAASLRKDEIYTKDPTTGKITGNVRLWKVMD
jgi:prepilin-type processing-associated H-X9-DG protein/prepilin-type N-terminal cleavage/methylation domain-containing protein